MLSSRVKYAVRAATRLAETYQAAAWTTTAEIAEGEHIPRKFLEAILVQLRDGGVVHSRRGLHGGHRLSRDPHGISVAQIVRLIDSGLALTPCACPAGDLTCIECVQAETCRLQKLLRQAHDAAAGVLETCSLASLTRPAGEADRPVPALHGRRYGGLGGTSGRALPSAVARPCDVQGNPTSRAAG